VFANRSARDLFTPGERLKGRKLDEILRRSPTIHDEAGDQSASGTPRRSTLNAWQATPQMGRFEIPGYLVLLRSMSV
jgi:hypothetical protein